MECYGDAANKPAVLHWCASVGWWLPARYSADCRKAPVGARACREHRVCVQRCQGGVLGDGGQQGAVVCTCGLCGRARCERSTKCPRGLVLSRTRRYGCVRVHKVVARLGFNVCVPRGQKVQPWVASTSVHAGHGHGNAMAWPRRWCNATRTNNGGLQGGTWRVGSLQAEKIGWGAMAFYGRFIDMSPVSTQGGRGRQGGVLPGGLKTTRAKLRRGTAVTGRCCAMQHCSVEVADRGRRRGAELWRRCSSVATVVLGVLLGVVVAPAPPWLGGGAPRAAAPSPPFSLLPLLPSRLPPLLFLAAAAGKKWHVGLGFGGGHGAGFIGGVR